MTDPSPMRAAGGDHPRPLAGVTVVELGEFIAGPFCTKILGEFGAEVIKIERPGVGDGLRKWRYLDDDGTSLWWHVQARNKKSIAVNLRDARGRGIVRDLCVRADVVVENFRPGTLEDYGLDWSSLAADNPGLIMARISGYGQDGPMRDLPGFGVIAEAMGGMRNVTGYPDRPPCRVGISIGDTLAALYGVIGVLLALEHRRATGRGQVVDVALFEAVFSVMESLLPEYDRCGVVRERTGSMLPGIAPSNAYACADGGYVLIGGNADAIFRRLAEAIGRPDLRDDPGLADNAGRARRQQWLDEQIESWTRSRSVDEVVAAMRTAEVPAGKIYSIADIVRDAQYQAREMIREVQLANGRSLKVPGVVPKLSATPGGFDGGGPRLGEHTGEVLAALGYDAEAIAALQAAGVVSGYGGR